jgi:hypothetical protein
MLSSSVRAGPASSTVVLPVFITCVATLYCTKIIREKSRHRF